MRNILLIRVTNWESIEYYILKKKYGDRNCYKRYWDIYQEESIVILLEKDTKRKVLLGKVLCNTNLLKTTCWDISVWITCIIYFDLVNLSIMKRTIMWYIYRPYACQQKMTRLTKPVCLLFCIILSRSKDFSMC